MSRRVRGRLRGWYVRAAVLAAGDALAAVLAYLLAFAIRIIMPLPLTQGYLPAVRFAEVEHYWITLVGLQLVALYALGLYETRLLTEPRRAVQGIGVAAVMHALAMVAVYFFLDLVFPRTVFVLLALGNATLLVVWRFACTALMWALPRRRVLVVGTVGAAREVIATIARQRWLGLDVVGVVTPQRENDGEGDVPVVGMREDLPALCERHGADDVIIVSEDSWQDRLIDDLSHRDTERSRVWVVPSPYEILIGRPEHLRLHDIPMLQLMGESATGGDLTKRAFDLAAASLLLVVASPVMLVVGALVRVTSVGPVIYRQRRVGRDRVPFTIFKFRTMDAEAEAGTGPVLARERDPRITGVGRLFRGTRLDELPQLWNVLRGDMSFVGPRPERPEFVTHFVEEIRGYAERFRVRPGLTGYAQVNGEYHSSPATKLKYDLAYMYNRTLWLDLRILADTARVMLTRRGA